jgi:hypothetical protein
MDPMDNGFTNFLKEHGHVDILEMLEQCVEAKMNSIIITELDKTGDEFVKAVFMLLNKYGISGTKAISFCNELDTLNKMFGNNKKTDEGVGEN